MIYYDIDVREMKRLNLKTPITFYEIEKENSKFHVKQLEGKYWKYKGSYRAKPLEPLLVIDEKVYNNNSARIKKIMEHPFNGDKVIVEL